MGQFIQFYYFDHIPANIRISDGSTYASEVDSIMARTRELSPEICQQAPEILAVFTGLRPSREGGARVEKEEFLVAGHKCPLVHNYGAGGTGFQAGFGMALESVAMVEDVLGEIRRRMPRASL